MRTRLFPGLLLFALFLIGALLAFSTNLTSYFLSDDFVQIGKVLSGDFSVVWGQAHGGFFRPVFVLSYIIDSRIWHARPLGYHLTNVTLHALNSFLLFQIAPRLLQRPAITGKTATSAALAAGALFLVHPSHTEAVTWISGRADLLATAFILLSVWCFITYLNQRRAFWLALTLAGGTVALLAKESAICLPFLILIIGLYLNRKRESLIAFGGSLGLVIGFIVVRAFLIGSFIGGYGASQHLNFSPQWIVDRLLEAFVRSISPTLPDAWAFFLFKPLQSRLFIVIAVGTCVLVATLIVFRRKQYHRAERGVQNRLLLTLFVLFLLSLLPAINLRLSVHTSLGERFLYLPTVFACLLMSYLSVILIRRPGVWLAILICILGFYAWRLYAANQKWRDAAQLTAAIKEQLITVRSKNRLVILNAPDNLRGVPIFHNGLPEMLQFFQNQRSVERVEILTFQTLQSSSAAVDLVNTGGTLIIQPRSQRDSFSRSTSVECLKLTDQSELLLRVQVLPCAAETHVYVFNVGEMRTLSGQSQ